MWESDHNYVLQDLLFLVKMWRPHYVPSMYVCKEYRAPFEATI